MILTAIEAHVGNANYQRFAVGHFRLGAVGERANFGYRNAAGGLTDSESYVIEGKHFARSKPIKGSPARFSLGTRVCVLVQVYPQVGDK